MLTLGINTASLREALVIIEEKKIIAEIAWQGARDETEKLLTAIERLFEKVRKSYREIDRIIIICGPGQFSALRIGVTVANILGLCLNACVYSLPTLRFWWKRLPKNIAFKNVVLLLHAGGRFLARSQDENKFNIEPLEKLSALADKPITFFGDLTQDEHTFFLKIKKKQWQFVAEEKLASFAEVIANMPLYHFKKEKNLAPTYWQPPHITKPHVRYAKRTCKK